MDTRRERSEDVNDIIDRLDDSVATARGIPLTGTCMVDREELLILIGAIRENLPAEIKQAAWMLDQNRQLIAEARKEADAIRRDAEAKMTSMIDEHEITERARRMAAETIDAANGSARQIRSGAMDYAKKKLSELEEQLTEILVTIQRHKKELK